MIIGGPGAGKSWLAGELGRRTGLPVFHVDDFVWAANGSVRAPEQIDRDLRDLASGERWIIEGGNSRTYAARAARADTIVHLGPPRWLRLMRVWRRDGWRWNLLKWTLHYDKVFGRKDRFVVESAPSGVRVHEFTSSAAVEGWLGQVERSPEP